MPSRRQRNPNRPRARKSRRSQVGDRFDGIDIPGAGSRYATRRNGLNAMRDALHRIPLFNQSSRRVILPYFESGVTRSGTAGAITNYFFSANGCFDPNVTGTGHQPMGFDEMMKYYEQYTVMKSTCCIDFVGNGTNACNVGLSLAPDTTAAVLGDNVENGQIVWSPIEGSAIGNWSRFKRLELSCDCGIYFGRKTDREMLNDTSLQGTSAANPSEQVYFDLQTWGFGGLTDNTSVYAQIYIEYDVVFWEPRKVGAELESSAEIHRRFLRTKRIEEEEKRSVYLRSLDDPPTVTFKDTLERATSAPVARKSAAVIRRS